VDTLIVLQRQLAVLKVTVIWRVANRCGKYILPYIW